MRELKFRIWDDGAFGGPSYIYDFSWTSKGKPISYFKPKEWLIEQYTGLKDKNGREIYEGDIVQFSDFPKTHNLNRYYLSNHGIKIVRWSLSHGGDYPFSGFSFVNWDSTDFEVGELVDCMNIQYCAVIGNIHENPSLLT